MNRKKGAITGVILGIPLLIGLGAGVAIVVVNQLGYVKSSNTAESDKSSKTDESQTSSTSSDPEEFYIGKNDKGSKAYINPSDVSCELRATQRKGETDGDSTYLTDSDGYYCSGNGYLLTLTDKKLPYNHNLWCAQTEKRWIEDGTEKYEAEYDE